MAAAVRQVGRTLAVAAGPGAGCTHPNHRRRVQPQGRVRVRVQGRQQGTPGRRRLAERRPHQGTAWRCRGAESPQAWTWRRRRGLRVRERGGNTTSGIVQRLTKGLWQAHFADTSLASPDLAPATLHFCHQVSTPAAPDHLQGASSTTLCTAILGNNVPNDSGTAPTHPGWPRAPSTLISQ